MQASIILIEKNNFTRIEIKISVSIVIQTRVHAFVYLFS